MLRDSSGRIVQLTDATGDPLKADLSRTYAMVACACPQPNARVGCPIKAKLSHRELFRLLLHNARSVSSPHHMPAAYWPLILMASCESKLMLTFD